MKGRFVRAALTVALLAGAAAGAQTFTWAGVTDSNWSTPTNWTPAGPPDPGSDAIMAGTPAVLMDIDGDLNSLTVSATTTFSSVGGLLGIGPGGLTRTAGNLTIDATMVVVLTASQTWSINGGNNLIQANLSGEGLTLTKVGIGSLTFGGDNSGVSSIVLNQGTIIATSAAALGGSAFTLGAGTLNLNGPNNSDYGVPVTASAATGTLNAQTTGNHYRIGGLTVPAGTNLTVGGVAGGSGSVLTTAGLTLGGLITKTSGNTALWVNGPYTESGGGAVTLRAAGASTTGAGLDQGLHFSTNNTMNAPITNGAAVAGTTTILGADSGAVLTYGGALNLGAFGSLVLTPRTGGVLALFGGSLATAQPLVIRGDSTGAVRFGPTFAFPAVSLTVDAATWETNNGASFPTSVLFTGTSIWAVRSNPHTFPGTVTVNGPTTIDTASSLTINGALGGNGALTKSNSSSLLLATGGSHSGGITMAPNGGTLSVTGTLSAEGAVSVAANDVFSVSGSVTTTGVTAASGGTVTGTGTIAGGVNLGAGANFTPGNLGTGALTTGPLALNDTTNLNFTIGTSGTSASTGPLTLDGILNIAAGTGFGVGTYTLFNTSGVAANNSLRQGSVPSGFAYIYNAPLGGTTVQLIVVNAPTAVELASFEAVSDGHFTQLLWQAGSEVRNLGYRVFREEGGRRREIGGGLIAGSALRARFDPLAGRDYAFVDTSGARGGTYWLQAVDTHGKTAWFGPVRARSGTLSARRSQPPMVLATTRPSAVLPTPDAQPVAAAGANRGALQILAPLARDAQWRLASTTGAAKVLVRQDGMVRVTAEQLVAAGFPAGAALSGIQLWSGGRAVAFRPRAFDGKTLQPGDALEFFGQAADTRFTDARVYWISSGLGSASVIQPASAPEATASATSFVETLEVRDRTLHIQALQNTDTEGFFGPVMVGTQPMDRIFSTPALALLSAGPATLEVDLQGLTDGAHAVDVRVNGVGVGTVHSVFQDPARAVFTLPPGTLVAGDNKVTLVGRTDGEIAVELSQRLTYPREYALLGPLRFTAPGGAAVELSGSDAPAAHVLDVTDPLRPVSVTTTASQNGALLATSGSGERILYAYRDQDVLAPAAVVPNVASHWHSDPGADLVVIGTSALLPSLAPLAAARRAEGLRVSLVDVEDIYDEFSAGQKDATAIRSFLQAASTSWSTRPRFVLLAGAATYDPRGWLGHPELDQVPTLIVDTRYLLTASDDALVTFDATRGPALAVGRLPFSTPGEMDAAVAKILGRSLATPAAASLLLVHDRDGNIQFSSATAEVRAALSAWNTQQLPRGDDDAASHTALLAALRSGPAAVDYQGHGTEDFWNGRLLSTDDVDALSNAGKTSLLVAATCLNGYFHDIGRESLGSALLRTPGGGAWGLWASSGMTFPTDHAALSAALLTAVLDQGLTLGEATLQAKQAVQDVDVRATFHLLGDPSARAVAAKSPAVTTPVKPAASASGCGTPGSPSIALAALALLALVAVLRRRPGAPTRS